ncbi:MAG: carboxypeptidase-like regulatory domain-containing protein [Chloroflexi bacterium]|nr:carboxypeptidase-like regulatory domain-containing protein [Chloroflexota bacterium]
MPRIRPLLAMLAVVALVAMGLTLPVFAQENGIIEGSVKDEQGAAVVGATVTVKNTGSGARRTTTTDSSGLYDVTNLAKGRYNVTVEANGFTAETQKDITLQVGTRVTLGFTLRRTVGEPPQAPRPPDTSLSQSQPLAGGPQNAAPQSTEVQPAEADALPRTGQPFLHSVLYLAGTLSLILGLGLRALFQKG